MFKIVQTTEKGMKELTIIPTAWEENGILSWPKTKVEKLIKNGKSEPEENWFHIPCKLKRNYLNSWDVAEEELGRMLAEEDTEQEESYLPRKMARVHLPQNPLDLNKLANSCFTNVSTHTELEEGDVTITEDTPTVFVCENAKVSPEEEIQSNKTDLILNTLSTLLENQDKIFQQMSKFETMLDAVVLEFIKTPTQCASCSKKKDNSVFNNDLFSPIEEIEQLNSLEEKLKKRDVFQNYVEQLSHICGKSGKCKGFDVSYNLVDKIFSRKFLVLCSWAGGSRDKQDKIPFKFYKNIIHLFFEVVKLADNNFTLTDMEIFFKNVIRNSVKRNSSSNMRSSKTKKRPSNLSYKTKQSGEEGTTGDDNDIDSNDSFKILIGKTVCS